MSLARLSWTLVSLSYRLLSVFSLSVRPSVCLFTFLIFMFFSRNQRTTKNHKVKGLQVCSDEVQFSQVCSDALFRLGDNVEIVQIHWRNIKIFFSKTTRLISTKLGTKLAWAKGIQVYFTEGPCSLPRGDDNKKAKMRRQHLKVLFSRPTRWLGTKHKAGLIFFNIAFCTIKLLKSKSMSITFPNKKQSMDQRFIMVWVVGNTSLLARWHWPNIGQTLKFQQLRYWCLSNVVLTTTR